MPELSRDARRDFENWCINGGRAKLVEIFHNATNAADLGLDAAWLAWQAASGEALRWIPVEEKLPEHRTKVLVYREPPYSPAIQSASYWEVHSKGAGFYCGDEVKGITHWQPLPADPAQWERTDADSRPSTEEK